MPNHTPTERELVSTPVREAVTAPPEDDPQIETGAPCNGRLRIGDADGWIMSDVTCATFVGRCVR